MRFDCIPWALIAGSMVLSAGTAQDPGVSMMVTTADGTSAGVRCEPFYCKPSPLDVTAGTSLLVEMFGAADAPYVLVAGSPTVGCVGLPWLLGEVALAPPVFLVDIGLVPASGLPNECGLETATTKIELPVNAPAGAQVVLQTVAWPAEMDMPALSRAVMLTVR